jgi:hypothetical protein
MEKPKAIRNRISLQFSSIRTPHPLLHLSAPSLPHQSSLQNPMEKPKAIRNRNALSSV